MDKQGRRDRKHLKEAKEIFQKMDRKDPIVSAYEQATGKKYELKMPEQKGQALEEKSENEAKEEEKAE